MESNWEKILEYYRKEKGSDLDGFELWSLSKWFVTYPIPMDKFERTINEESLKSHWEIIEQGNAMPLSSIAIKPVQELSIKTLHYQALLDFKENKCTLETVNYIEKYLNGK